MINWNRVQALYRELGPAEFSNVMEQLLDELHPIVEKLQSPNPLTVEGDLHRLKTCAMNVGFEDLADKCRHVERQLRPTSVAVPLQDGASPFAALLQCFDRSMSLFDGEWSMRVAA
jgi:HPt (histidine-containing phosphotransfer) domain-containing protein